MQNVVQQTNGSNISYHKQRNLLRIDLRRVSLDYVLNETAYLA